jgi:ribonuclease P protein component
MPKIGIEDISNAELHQQLKFAWQKLNRLVHKRQNNTSISPQK